ncbi:hypothetical protein KR222_000065 [Zaprionus bogoriensis]|nr:hypothetical protein KR222_000065 [Zaprionus bogoriensis]
MLKSSLTIHVFQLNDYCLEQILSYLSMKDHLSFAATCCRFRQVFKHWAIREYSSFILVAPIPATELKLFSLVAENVKKLSIDVDDLVSSLASNHTLGKVHLFRKFCRLLQCEMKHLHTVNLWQYDKKDHGKKILAALHNHRSIKHLEVSLNSKALEELRISFVQNTDISVIYLDLIRACPKLQLLRILDVNISADFVMKASKVLDESQTRPALSLFIPGHRQSTISRTARDIDNTHLLYKRMTAKELLKL